MKKDCCDAALSWSYFWYENRGLLPDKLYLAAERQVNRTRKSRSQLYAEALAEYLARHASDEVIEAMNQVVVEHTEW